MHSDKDDVSLFFSSVNFDRLFNSAHIPIAFVDSKLKIIWCSDKFLSKFNFTGKEISLSKLFNMKKEELQEFFPGNIKLKKLNAEINKIDEHYFSVLLTDAVDGGDKQDNRIKQFKNFVHDLNNILTSIMNSASMLRNEIPVASKAEHLLDNLENNSQRAVDILENVLSTDAGNQAAKHKVDIKSLLNELNQSLKSIFKNKFQLNFSIDDSLELITGNYSEIYRVFLNLCMNASEAIKSNGKIKVHAENVAAADISAVGKTDTDIFVKVGVKDNGTGIRKKNLEKIFQPSFSTKQKNRESGLGLSIVKEIIEKHNGYIDIKSKWLRGTEFIIYLPARQKLKRKDFISEGNKKIIIADDELSILELLTDLFESYNYDVVKATNGKEVLELLDNKVEPDLFVIDRKMPVMNGIKCIKKFRDSGINKPVILTTGSQSVKDNPVLDGLNVEKVLVKPYDFEDLLKTVKEVLS